MCIFDLSGNVKVLLVAALDWARRGIPVFPCKAGAKVPACGEGGVYQATTDADLIKAWWTQTPTANIRMVPEDAGWGVVDIDGSAREATWARRQAAHDHAP